MMTATIEANVETINEMIDFRNAYNASHGRPVVRGRARHDLVEYLRCVATVHHDRSDVESHMLGWLEHCGY